MNKEKEAFVLTGFTALVQQLSPSATGLWGKMKGQQMVEHVAGFFKISAGRLRFELVTPAEQLPKFREFLLSDKPFRENTKAPASVLSEEPLPLRYANMGEAIVALEKSIGEFVKYYQTDDAQPTVHPVFGALNYDEWIQLHHKHVVHHAKQFGLM